MFKLKLKKSAGIALAMLAGVSAFPAFAADTVATKDLEIGTKPLYVGSSDLPMLIMLILSKDYTMFTEAYTDANDIDGDGRIDVTIHSRPVGMTSQAGISPLPDRV